MRSITLAASALVLTGLGAAPAFAHPTTSEGGDTVRERGVLFECIGEADGLAA